jgi:hypothetical protein
MHGRAGHQSLFALLLLSALLVVSALLGCSKVRCTTKGCGVDYKFSTTTEPVLPGSQDSQSNEPVPAPASQRQPPASQGQQPASQDTPDDSQDAD